MINQTESYEPQRGLTFEDVWTALMETRKLIEKVDLQQEETDRKFGELGNRFGELAEHLVAPNIIKKFNALGYRFNHVSRDHELHGPGGVFAEIDLLLENGKFVMAVEVKAKPLMKDVDGHKKRMAVIRNRGDEHGDQRKFLGAIAGAIMTDTVRNYALESGFYVIEQSGDTVKIDVPKGFKPREW
jgi:hypothetical protein